MVFKASRHVDIPTKDITSWVFDECHYDPDRPVLLDALDSSRSVSFNQAREMVRQLVAGFHHAGLQPGDCVCVHAFNDVYYPILVMGIYAAGGIFAGTNPAYTKYELCHHIKTAKIKYLISEPELLGPLLEAAKESDISPEKIWVFHPLPSQKCPPGQTSWKQLFTHGSKDWIRFDSLETSRTTIAMRLFSSGTTGLPKAACCSHYNFIAQHTLVFENDNKDYEKVYLYATPMFHAAVAPRVHTSVFKSGESNYVMRRFELEPFLASIEKYGVTDLTVVPPMAIMIIMSPLSKKYSFKSVRAAIAGAAPLGKESQARLKALLPPGTPMTQVWGMTESSCIATRFLWPEDDHTGSVGRPVANLDMKLVDTNDPTKEITAYDTPGEICIRGPTVIPGYFENPAANAASYDADGFFHTGDIGYCASGTHLWYIVDRKKELIKVRGFQVAPPELETALLEHPDIVDAAVIGVPSKNERDGEWPRAYVVRRPGSASAAKLTEEDVRNFIEPKLASYKKLTGGVRFVDTIPKNASGKILKRILREEAKKEMDSPKMGSRL